MIINPVGQRVTIFEVPVVPRLSKVVRARSAEEDVLVEEQEQRDIKNGRPKKKQPRHFSARSSAAAQSSTGVLSALIGFQEVK
jgi:hypothetical protein